MKKFIFNLFIAFIGCVCFVSCDNNNGVEDDDNVFNKSMLVGKWKQVWNDGKDYSVTIIDIKADHTFIGKQYEEDGSLAETWNGEWSFDDNSKIITFKFLDGYNEVMFDFGLISDNNFKSFYLKEDIDGEFNYEFPFVKI